MAVNGDRLSKETADELKRLAERRAQEYAHAEVGAWFELTAFIDSLTVEPAPGEETSRD